MTSCECDARVGAELRVESRIDEADPAVTPSGVCTEVALHERAVHAETMALVSGEMIGSLVEDHEFAELRGITTMRITQADPAKEARDGTLESGMDRGQEARCERLDLLLAQPARGRPRCAEAEGAGPSASKRGVGLAGFEPTTF